jgi:hypothetical protein
VQCRYPYVTGTSVLGITYKDGVLLASDTLGGQPPLKGSKQTLLVSLLPRVLRWAEPLLPLWTPPARCLYGQRRTHAPLDNPACLPAAAPAAQYVTLPLPFTALELVLPSCKRRCVWQHQAVQIL